MKAELVINVGETCKRFEPRYHRAQMFIDSEVLRDSAPYVPMSSSITKGNLMKSGNRQWCRKGLLPGVKKQGRRRWLIPQNVDRPQDRRRKDD